jgi:hypothetical protein
LNGFPVNDHYDDPEQAGDRTMELRQGKHEPIKKNLSKVQDIYCNIDPTLEKLLMKKLIKGFWKREVQLHIVMTYIFLKKRKR